MAVLLEIPRENAAIGRQANADATMGREVLGDLRDGVSGEIVGGADHRHAHVGPNPHRNHVLGDLFAQAHAGVIALRDDVRQPVVDDDLHPDIGVLEEHAAQRRLDHEHGRMLTGVDTDRACGFVAELAQVVQFLHDLIEVGAPACQAASVRPRSARRCASSG